MKLQFETKCFELFGFFLETVEITDQMTNMNLKTSNSSAELPTSSFENTNSNKPNCSGSSQWNPFEDPTPFNAYLTEDHIYEAEFDALRDRPNGNVHS